MLSQTSQRPTKEALCFPELYDMQRMAPRAAAATVRLPCDLATGWQMCSLPVSNIISPSYVRVGGCQAVLVEGVKRSHGDAETSNVRRPLLSDRSFRLQRRETQNRFLSSEHTLYELSVPLRMSGEEARDRHSSPVRSVKEPDRLFEEEEEEFEEDQTLPLREQKKHEDRELPRGASSPVSYLSLILLSPHGLPLAAATPALSFSKRP
ncbi:unnamed protein product [Pleuronectes platessa]|uniref:Uncharacterized protein n=1 Tax=Pleuronectes platessa TaxID=8262 RepID=A0A9N7U3C4_PLEPL|nr:unnamed protein product [Pleuronectes platessa]